ncbi:hypothetical protein [Sphingobium sp. YR768]|uniref:hypothetical protein n=1 Tax=Sphingobium sp. YR768 TaxID=1884365 RepID=UPI00115FA658|nr:hypothetical protein [Sphingobium sp. YR768]
MKTALFMLSAMFALCVSSNAVHAAPSLANFAECLVQYDTERMKAWVDWDGPGLIYKELASAVNQSGCYQSGHWDYWNFRGALSEALLKKKYSSGPIPDLENAKPVTDIEMALAWGNNDGRESMLLNVYSECEARNNSEKIFRIFMIKPNGPDKNASLKILKNSGKKCRSLAGNIKINSSNQALHARLAIAFYLTDKDIN